MELLDVTLTALQRRNRAAFVDRDEPTAPLVPGQKVVLRDEAGEYFAGTVIEEPENGRADARYLVHLGVRLPEEYALLRLGQQRSAPDAERLDDVQAMLDLLGEAREAFGRVPSQRFTS